MTRGISRGLLATEGRIVFGRADPATHAERAFEALRSSPPGAYTWKEKNQWAKRLARGDSDFYGHRILTDAGRSDCRYVRKVCRRALDGELPEGRAWGYLRESLLRIFRELEVGA